MKRVDFSNEYFTQQTCLNGHVTNNYEGAYGYPSAPFCDRCGAETISACPECDGPIKGGSKLGSGPPRPAPAAYCLHCGKPYPWTAARSAAMQELAAEESNLSLEDRATLRDILPDLTAQAATPRTELAIFKMKKLLQKGGPMFAASIRRLFVDVVSETVKKALLEP
jgi:hypothetical protein